MRRLRTLLTLLFIGSSLAGFSQGNLPDYLVSADLSYEANGNKTYTFTLTVYTECGSNFGLDANIGLPLDIKSEKLGEEFEVSATKINTGEEIKVLCDKEQSNCSNSSNPNRGIKKFIFVSAPVSLAAFDDTDDWLVSFVANFRSYALNTISGDQQTYYVEALINTQDFPDNNSPVFLGGSKGPIVRVCVGEEFVYNPQASDADGDELRYSLISPQQNASTAINYLTGYSTLKPVSMSSNLSVGSDGDIAILATQPDELGITDLVVEEYEDGKLKGRVVRGVQIHTFDCENEAPLLGTFNLTGEEDTTICAGTEILDWKDASDPENEGTIFTNVVVTKEGVPVNNGVERFFIQGIVGNNGRLFIRGTPTADQAGTYVVSVTVEDLACPTPRDATFSFELTIVEPPQFELGDNDTLNCTEHGNAWGPQITVANPPATYLWEDTLTGEVLSTSETVNFDEEVYLRLTVIDALGCVHKDSIHFYDPFDIRYHQRDYCEGDTTILVDSSNSANGGIVNTTWIFTNPTNETLTGTQVEYKFPTTPGNYPFQLIVEDASGCIDTVNNIMTICAPPTNLNIGWVGTDIQDPLKPIICTSRNGDPDEIPLMVDSTAYVPGCEIREREWNLFQLNANGDTIAGPNLTSYCVDDPLNFPLHDACEPGKLSGEGDPHPFEFPVDSIWYATMEVVSWAGCTADTIESHMVFETPEFTTDIENFVINCNDPDQEVVLKLDTTLGIPTYTWTLRQPPSLSEDVIATIDDPSVIDSAVLVLNQVGNYEIILRDENDCNYRKEIIIAHPLEVTGTASQVCNFGDSVEFNGTILHFDENNPRTIVSTTWSFGDGNSADSLNPLYAYGSQNEYTAVFTAVDSTGCSSSFSVPVFYTFPVVRMEIDPDLNDKPVCVGEPVTLKTYYWPSGFTHHFDTINWLIDYQTPGFTNRSESYYDDPGIPLSVTDGYTINEIFTEANSANGVVVYASGTYYDNQCTFNDSLSIDIIYPELDIESFVINRCQNDSMRLWFERTINPDIDIVSANWTITRQTDIIAEVEDLNPVLFVKPETFPVGGDYLYSVEVVDENGCETEIRNRRFTVSFLPPPLIRYEEDICPGQEMFIELYFEDNGIIQPSQLDGVNYLINTENGDTILDPVKNNPFDNPDPNAPLNMGSYIFATGGDHRVFAYVGDERDDCRAVLDTIISTKDIGDPDFITDTVCAGQESRPTNFENLTNGLVEDPIISWLWDFGDENSSDEFEPSHIYEQGGVKTVTLTVESESGCMSSIKKDIFVQYSPLADFDADTANWLIGNDIDFRDLEKWITVDVPQNIIYHEYFFGDGNTETEIYSPTHSYSFAAEDSVYKVLRIMENDEGCRDTFQVCIDLKTYLELPNAFTPNGDDNNDILLLIKKNVDLEYLKVFNRYGEIVYETYDVSDDDIAVFWDGKHRGVDQEIGSYVAVAVGTDAYGRKHKLKRNITLLR